MSDWSFFLNIGTTFATFNWSGNMPVVIDWLIISVIHSHISFAILFSRVGVKYSTCTWYLYLSTYLSVLDVLEYLVYENDKVLVLDQKYLVLSK